ncbi:MAG: FUSC family protein [Vulcanococcus sp.]
MLISRAELRLALTAGLANGFASISGLPFGMYMPLAVLAVCTGTYGSSLELGRQRLLGSALGSVVLLISFHGLKGLPFPLAIAITLASLRALGGWLGLQVGYKVGGIIVVMGWIVHDQQLDTWLGLRLFWTTLGILFALLSLRLFWPSRALATALGSYDQLLMQLQQTLSGLAAELDPQHPTAIGAAPPDLTPADLRALRLQLLNLRRQRPALANELGSNPLRHPAYRLMLNLDEAASRLITSLAGMQRHRPPASLDAALVKRLHRAEAQLLRQLVERLAIWRQRLQPTTRSRRLPPPPQPPLEPPSTWLELASDLNDTEVNAASLDRLERIAARLVLCRQALQAVSDGERQWAAILNG